MNAHLTHNPSYHKQFNLAVLAKGTAGNVWVREDDDELGKALKAHKSLGNVAKSKH